MASQDTWTLTELEVMLGALNSALAGDTSEGDDCWTDSQHDAALSAARKLQAAIAAHLPTRRLKYKPIRVGQRLVRWDGESGYVDLNSRGTRVYGPGEPFQIIWEDGASERITIERFEEEGIRRGRGVMKWAR